MLVSMPIPLQIPRLHLPSSSSKMHIAIELQIVLQHLLHYPQCDIGVTDIVVPLCDRHISYQLTSMCRDPLRYAFQDEISAAMSLVVVSESYAMSQICRSSTSRSYREMRPIREHRTDGGSDCWR